MKNQIMSFSKQISQMNEKVSGTLMSCLNISFTDYTDGVLTAEMPVNENTRQIFGALHGGATMALIESVGGALSFLELDNHTEKAVGIEINGNHLRSVSEGKVIAKARILHKGKSIHVVDVQVHDVVGNLVCVGRITNKIISR